MPPDDVEARSGSIIALCAALLVACGEPAPAPAAPTLAFDQGDAIGVEAGESVNLSVTLTAEPGFDPTIVWEATCGHVMGLERRGSYVAPDAAGACEVSATSLADPSVEARLHVEVSAPVGGGAVRWTRHVASDLDDQVRRVAADPDGGVVAIVETSGDLGGTAQGDLDVVVVRLDPLGDVSWTTRLATSTREFAGGVAVGPDGDIVVVGSTYGELGAPSAGESDAFVARVSPAGEVEWVRQFGTERTDTAQAVAIDGDGGLWIAGWTEGGLGGTNQGGPDGYLRRLAPDGEVLWTRQFGGAGIDFAIAVALDGDGAVVAGNTDGVVGDASGGGSDGYLAWITGDGEVDRIDQHGAATDDRFYGIAARPGGGVVVAGANGDDGFFTAFDATGAAIWTHAVATVGLDMGQAVDVEASGDVVAVGFSTGDVGTPNVGFADAFVVRLDPDGAPRWTRRIGSAADDYGWATAFLSDGDVAVGGRTDGLLADGAGWGGDGFVRRLGP